MNTTPENPANETEANTQSGITRRTFIKRTTATAVVTALAIDAFRSEARADGSGSESIHVLATETYKLDPAVATIVGKPGKSASHMETVSRHPNGNPIS